MRGCVFLLSGLRRRARLLLCRSVGCRSVLLLPGVGFLGRRGHEGGHHIRPARLVGVGPGLLHGKLPLDILDTDRCADAVAAAIKAG